LREVNHVVENGIFNVDDLKNKIKYTRQLLSNGNIEEKWPASI